MNKLLASLLATITMLCAAAQQPVPVTDTSSKYSNLDEVVISSGNFAENKKEHCPENRNHFFQDDCRNQRTEYR